MWEAQGGNMKGWSPWRWWCWEVGEHRFDRWWCIAAKCCSSEISRDVRVQHVLLFHSRVIFSFIFIFLFSVINELLRRESVASYIYQFWADVVMRSPWLVTVGVNGAPKRLGHTLTCYSRGTWGPLTRFPAVQEMIISSEKSGTKSTLRWGCSWTAARVQGDKFKGLGGGGVGGSGDVRIRWHFELTSRCLTLVLTS